MTAVAWIGLGAMGGRMADRLLGAGHEVVAWNRTASRTEKLVALGATAAPTPAAAAAAAEVVITTVADPGALRAVVDGPHGVAAGARPGSAIVEMSTVGPASVRWLASVLPSGAQLLDAPVLGSLAEAEAGTLQLFVGGPPELVERCRPLLAVLGALHHVGPLGAGAAAKLVANTSLLGVLGVLGEALALADGLGLSRTAAYDVLASTPLAAQAQRRREALEAGDFPPRFALHLARKDAELIDEAALAAAVDLRLASALRSWLADADRAGWADRDYTAVLAHILSSPPKPRSGP